MFDVGASEFLLIVIVAIVVIGPKDMPVALRTAGRWIGKVRRVSGHFRTGIESMIREAELEEMEKKWKEQNEAIVRDYPLASENPDLPPPYMAETADLPPPASAEAALAEPAPLAKPKRKPRAKKAQPQLPIEGV